MHSHAHKPSHVTGSHKLHTSNSSNAPAGTALTSDGGGEGHHHDGAITGIMAADNIAVTGTTGNDHIMAGANDTLTGAGGNDEFVIGPASGKTEITDFGVSGATAGIIDLKHSGVASTTFGDLLTHVTEIGGNAVIDLGNGNSLTLDKVDMAALTAANFELPGSGGSGGAGGPGGDNHGGGDHHAGPSMFQGYLQLMGTSGDDSLTATAANTIIIGGGGNDTLIAGAGNDLLAGGGGNDSLVGSTGNDTLIAGGGNDTLTGGGGSNVFSIAGEHGTPGNTEITDFNASTGVVRLEHTGLQVASFADFLTHVSQIGANTVVDLGNSHAITLDNVTMSSLSAADFVFC